MVAVDPAWIPFVLLLAAGVGAGAVLLFRNLFRPSGPKFSDFDPHAFEPAVFVFDSRLLVDATDRGKSLLRRAGDGPPWTRLIAELSRSFEDIEDRLLTLPRTERLEIWSAERGATPTRVTAEWRNGMLRITVVEADESEATVTVDAQSIFALERDASLLRSIAGHAPVLIWKTRADTGEITWANRAYLDLVAEALGDSEISWPPPRVFGRDPGKDQGARPKRAPVGLRTQPEQKWFDITSRSFGAQTLHFALPADAAVRSDRALREFIQTLATTFAHLPVGLAIFNRDRRLVLFNPALTDLTGLAPAFLADRPSLPSFLDELRNRQVMPEPKNYPDWRRRIAELEAQAVEGTYSETWSLSTGSTYRVTGRPHPEGALALLIEDITSEVALTRRFRNDMELGQSVLDNIPEAIAAFSHEGILVLANDAYVEMWGLDPRTSLGQITVTDALACWLERAEPSPTWGEIRDFVSTVGERGDWAAEARLKGGPALDCRFHPLAGGGTLIAFSRKPVLVLLPPEEEPRQMVETLP